MITRKQLRAFLVRRQACPKGLARFDASPGSVYQVIRNHQKRYSFNYNGRYDLLWTRSICYATAGKISRELLRLIMDVL